MRTVEEIKADIASAKQPIWKRQFENELYKVLTSGIPLDRLETICTAENDGRCVVLPPVKGADIGNPLEPLKVYAALKSEVLKYDYRAEHEPEKISALDYTIIMALQDVLNRAEAEKALEDRK